VDRWTSLYLAIFYIPPGGLVDLHTFYTFVEYILIISSLTTSNDSELVLSILQNFDSRSSETNEIAQIEQTARTF